MADPVITNRFLILVGNGATPTEVFGAPCGVTVRNATFANTISEWLVMDCDDPLDYMPTMQRVVTSQDTSLEISGRLARTALPIWRAWSDSGAARNIRVLIEETAANNGGYWQLPALLTSLQIGQESLDGATISAQIAGAGRRVWTAAA